MRLLSTFFLIAILANSATTFANDGFCTKCEIMKEYHRNHPSKYQYYEDYLKDLESKGGNAAEPSQEDLPPDVKYIMNQKSDAPAPKKK